MSAETCRWDQWDPLDFSSTWEIACGGAWELEDGTPAENGIRFCHQCGKPVDVHPWSDDDEGEDQL